jgi:hypothetical protein
MSLQGFFVTAHKQLAVAFDRLDGALSHLFQPVITSGPLFELVRDTHATDWVCQHYLVEDITPDTAGSDTIYTVTVELQCKGKQDPNKPDVGSQLIALVEIPVTKNGLCELEVISCTKYTGDGTELE